MDPLMTDKTDETPNLVPDDQRINITADLFGPHFPLRLEPVIYSTASRMAPAYQGGFWQFWRFGNGAFLMTPDDDRMFTAHSMNGWHGELSADALGFVVCLTAYSHLSFSGDGAFPRECARQYHLLRQHLFCHDELAAILSAID
jgi:hypothetical protein